MKKLILLLSVLFLTLAGCEGPPGRDGLDGLNGTETYWFVKTYEIQSSHWQLVHAENQVDSYFRARVTIPELTRDRYEDGNVQCYMFQNIDGQEVQTPLPFTIPCGIEENNGNRILWTETYAFDFAPGAVTFYVNYSDFFTSNRPGTTTFRVVITY